jgi:hypothetical protein
VAKVGTSKVGGTVSRLGCGTSVACHGQPIKEEEEITVLGTVITVSLIPCVTNDLNLVNKANLGHNLFLVYLFINLYMFWATLWPSSGETTVSVRHLVLVILCGWLWYAGRNSTLRTRQSSTQNHKYQVSPRYSCFS